MEIEDLDKELVDLDVVEPYSNEATLEEWRRASSTVRTYLAYKEGMGEQFDEEMNKMASRLDDIDTPREEAEDETKEEVIPEVLEWLNGESSAEPEPRYTQSSLLTALTGETLPEVLNNENEDEDDIEY